MTPATSTPLPQLVIAVIAVFVTALTAGCGGGKQADPLDPVADAYVQLALAVGRHDESFVDAYYGPQEWKQEAAKGEPRPVAELRAIAGDLLARARRAPESGRRAFLEKQLVAVDAFLRRLSGEKMNLAEEARLLYDIAPPKCGPEVLEPARERLESLLPGDGELAERTAALRRQVEVPRDKLPGIADTALAETRRRTGRFITLPAGERFEIAYVTGKPWAAYNWYKGDLRSLIEVNTDLPVTLDGVLDVLAHEGYPGHHVYNALLENDLVRGRGWREFTIYPLYSPQSLVAEGTANVGAEIVFTEDERRAFLADVLAPAAGVDAAAVERWGAIQKAVEDLRCTDGEAARMLLDEGRPEEEVVAFLVRYGTSPERARQNVRFFQGYRSYVHTYTAGERLVRAYVGTGSDRAERFFDLLRRPVTPSEIAAGGR